MKKISSSSSIAIPRFRCFDPANSYTVAPIPKDYCSDRSSPASNSSSIGGDNKGFMGSTAGVYQSKIVTGDAGYVLEDVPHLTDYIPDLPDLGRGTEENILTPISYLQ